MHLRYLLDPAPVDTSNLQLPLPKIASSPSPFKILSSSSYPLHILPPKKSSTTSPVPPTLHPHNIIHATEEQPPLIQDFLVPPKNFPIEIPFDEPFFRELDNYNGINR